MRHPFWVAIAFAYQQVWWSKAMTKQQQQYKVSYRVGVKNRCQWREMFGNLSYDEAKKEAEGILRQGYRAIVHKDNGHGLPVTWEAGQSPDDYYEDKGWLILKGGAYDQ